MGIFDFFREKTDVEEYYEKRKKEKKKENVRDSEFTGYVEVKDNMAGSTPELNKILHSNLNKIEKIKRVREITGLGLKEAKEMVERAEEDIFPDEKENTKKVPVNMESALDEILHSNLNKIEKIKRVREITGFSLKDAKELVEKYER